MTNKISKSTFKNEWGTGQNKTFFHEIEFEGDTKKYSIGSKQQSPAFLAVGQNLEWDWKDMTKGSIKKAAKPFGQANNLQVPTVVMPATDPSELRISTGLIAASVLYAAGKIQKEQINEIAANVARKFDEIKASL